MSAKLVVTYDRETLASGYHLGVNVDSTVGIDLRCLLIQNGDFTRDEAVMRFATLPDFYYPLAPSGFNILLDPVIDTIPGIVPGDHIKITGGVALSLWGAILSPAPLPTYYAILDVLPACVRISPIPARFPWFGRNLSYDIWDSTEAVLKGSGTAGVANRDYSGMWATYYRVLNTHDVYPDILVAVEKFLALRAEGQALVDSTNTEDDYFLGDITETYE